MTSSFHQVKNRSSVTVSGLALLTVVSVFLLGAMTPWGHSPYNPTQTVVPRYALIDFGTNFIPVGLNNSNMVVGYVPGGSAAAIWNWTANSVQLLSTNAVGNIYTGPLDAGANVVGIDDAGHIAGTGSSLSYPYGPQGCYWASSSANPMLFAPGYFDFGYINAISDQGFMVGNSQEVLGTVLAYNLNNIVSWGAGKNYITSQVLAPANYATAAGQPGYGMYVTGAGGSANWVGFGGNGASGYPIINGVAYNSYTDFYLYAVNDSGLAAGANYNDNSAWLVSAGSGSTLNMTNLGVGDAWDINNHLDTNNMPAPQIIGTDYEGNATLWDKTAYDGTPCTNAATGNYAGKVLDLLIGGNTGWTFGASKINNIGVIAGNGYYSGTNSAISPGKHGLLLLPAELAVDANRDGTVVMANDANNPANVDIHGNPLPVDTTSQAKPYRFWINNDDDNGSGTGGSEVISSPTPDSSSDHIVSVRDLEDWTRLWIYTKGLNTAIASGAIKVGLKWKNVASGTTPGIKLVKATDSDGGLEYLQDSSGAAASAQTTTGGPILVDAGGSHSNIVPTSASADFVFPTSVWASLTDAAPKTYFLFEGTSEGKGQLEIVFLKSDGTTEIGEGGNLWLDLHDIKEMYQREKAEPETIAAPYSSGSDDPAPVNMTPADDTGSFTFSPDPNETKDYFVFVHGWNMSYDGSTNYAETMFKRLWWRGYKGRFAAFRWPTYYSNFPVFDPYGTAAIEASLARYNDSEYIGWESGHALAQYVNSLPSGYTRHVASHSMGAIVVASAFQQPIPMSAAYYTPLHAAIPAYCYDPTTTALEDAYTTAGYVTPDHDSDPATSSMAYRGRVTGVGGATVTSFYDSADSALQSWESNNHLTKPQPLYAYLDGYYFYSPSSPNGQKLGLQFILVTGRYMTDKYESMAYADKSLTKTLGADGRTAGLIGSGVDMNARYSFGTEHSAEFGRPITQVDRYYYDVMSQLGLSENYLDATHPAVSP